jgi:hypothetical protein
MIHLDYSGGWLVGLPLLIGFLILLGIALVPWLFFLLNLQNLLDRVNDRNRAMPAGQVWLNFIPLFNLGWFVYTVVKVRDSVRDEYASRGWPVAGDLGYNVGISAAVLLIATLFLSWIPVIGWGLIVAYLVCWIIYWVRMAELKNRLGESGLWRGPVGPYSYSGPMGPPPGSLYSPPASTMPPDAGISASPQATPRPAAGPGSVGSPTSPAEPEGRTPRESCPACGAQSAEGDRYCRTCGQSLV